jgi:hypothetical protein
MIVGTAAALLCVNTSVLVGPVARALDGADLSSLVGPVVGACLYVALTARSRRAAVVRADGERARPAVTAVSVE